VAKATRERHEMDARVQELRRVDSSDREQVRRIAHPLGKDDPRRANPLIEMIGDAQMMLLGEASHGTHEFYCERALNTRRLLGERGFIFVAVEGAWPDARQWRSVR
jgi:erythromycin esterase-like protein